ncbi:MAG: 3-deoxy-D-manno-octulosonic acid transferase [Thermoanaerobaculia bacterium]|nr:3-deoxy-D-manno-octulosonic acid transferase [Thermoanaerobaculia bacterium]
MTMTNSAENEGPTVLGSLRWLSWLVYEVVYTFLSIVAAPFLWMRKGGPKRDGLRHYLETLPGRTTLRLPAAPLGTRAIWVHCVSVGEAMVGTTLVKAMLDRLPEEVAVVLTTITPTGQRQAANGLRRRVEEGRVAVAYLPFDLRPLLARFHRRFRPTAMVLVEGDYWPLALADAARRSVPVAVVNGRSSDRAFRRQKALGRVNDLFYRHVDAFGVQTDDDARRFETLGVEPEKIQVTGNLKFDAPPPGENPGLEQALLGLAGGRPILVAGSTMSSSNGPSEDEMVLDAFESLRSEHDGLLILAPRHPERFGHVAEVLERRGLAFVRRSDPEQKADGAKPAVVLLDTLGELSRVYCLAQAAFIGGTLVPTGGHNPLEPAQFAVPTVVGPSMHNFREMAAIFDRRQAWSRVDDLGGLARQWGDWLADPPSAQAVGRRAKSLLEEGTGAVERSLTMLEPLLSDLQAGGS